MTPKFDLIDEQGDLPHGFRYAYGYSPDLAHSFYGIVAIDNHEIITDAIVYVTVANSLIADCPIVEKMKSNFTDAFIPKVSDFEDDLKEAI